MRQLQLEIEVPEPAPEVCSVPGFSLQPEYLSKSEEKTLLSHVMQGTWETDWKRRIQQFGLGYGGKHGGTAVWLRDFPDWLRPLADRVGVDAGFGRFPENCVINEYIPPQGIAPHSDYSAFGPRIACVSLGSDIVMDLVQPGRGVGTQVHVPARSLWVLSGEARTEWQHGIAPRLTDVIEGERRHRERRVSITFRTAA